MDETTYKILMGTSAFIVAMLGSMLATTTIPPECGLEKLRKARNILVPSYFVLALLSLVCCFTGYDHRIEPASTLFVASFQAFLFTMSMLVFIRPGEVRWSVPTGRRHCSGRHYPVCRLVLFYRLLFVVLLYGHRRLYYPVNYLYPKIHASLPQDGTRGRGLL